MKFPYEKKFPKIESQEYEFFDSEEWRQEVFDFSKKIAEYLRSENIPNLIIIDRSSRPLHVGVREYLKSKYPTEKMPSIYFMNPKGFKAKEELSEKEIEEIIKKCIWKDDLTESKNQIRSKEEILYEFKDTYKELVRDKEKPVLVFDTCIHSGDSLDSIKKSMIDLGFSDIKIGAITESNNSKVKTDFYVTNERPENGCYPFGRDRIIEKTFEHIYSRKTEDLSRRDKSIRLRNEIKRIMNDFLNKK